MGGLGRALPYTRWVFLIGALALVGIPPFSGFFSKDPIIAAQLDRGGARLLPLRVRDRRRVPHRPLHLPALLHRLRRRAVRVRARAPARAARPAEGPLSMVWPVGVLAVLAAFAGWIQFAPFWDADHDLARPGRGAAARADAARRRRSPRSLAVALGLAGIGVAWLDLRPRSGGRCRSAWLTARAQVLLRRALRRRLLPAGRGALARALRVRRAAADRRLDHRGHARLPARLARARPRPERPRPHLRARARERDRRPRRRLHRRPR